MVSDEFALAQFRQIYGHYFVEIKLHRGPGGGTEILGLYNKPRFKRDWVPKQFCRRPVRCVRIAEEQPAQDTPMPAGAAKS